jgi:miniconductance mechanosensitive channel
MQALISDHPWAAVSVALVTLLLLAWLADTLVRRIFLGIVRRLAARTRSTWDDRLIEHRVFARIAHVAPAMVMYSGIAWALAPVSGAAGSTLTYLLVRRVSLAFIVLTVMIAASNFLVAVNAIYNETYEEATNRPIKGYLQVVSTFLFVAAGIVIVAILADRSPVVFLSGLGALTAVLLLVFRDTLLSLVASVQIMSNDMIRIGDWVEMPEAHADGDVIDIALHTVKVQNWDKTITTVPTYHFITQSFKNWRGMSESGGRRIKRSLHLDVSSIHFLTPDEIERLGRYEFLRDYMSGKRRELEEANQRDPKDPDVIPERRRLTNVGTFRAYVDHYLRHHPKLHQDMTLLVRQLQPGPEGLPLEIYCFTNDTAWASYERIQADLFDHLIAILPEFGLRAYQQPAGSDLTRWAASRSRGHGDGRSAERARPGEPVT